MKLDSMFIVKVQIPVISNMEDAGALVYDETHEKFHGMVPIDDNIEKAMNGRFKAFFMAGWKGKTFYLATETEVEDPGW